VDTSDVYELSKLQKSFDLQRTHADTQHTSQQHDVRKFDTESIGVEITNWRFSLCDSPSSSSRVSKL